MVNLKNITELPVAESAEGLNLIVNDNGAAKQIPAGEVGAQPDWNETDESSPAFIANKPDVALKSDLVEEFDLDIEFTISWEGDSDGGEYVLDHTVNRANTFEEIKNKLLNGDVVKYKTKSLTQPWGYQGASYSIVCHEDSHISYMPEGISDNGTELIAFYADGWFTSVYGIITPNNEVQLFLD